jgi:EAL domain-containing protein (putative c-di-GMP-specific phosphodiesterase class I)
MGLPADRDDTAITQAVIALAHSMGMRVVAEGVETDAQMAVLRHLQCDEVQGFLLGKPQAPEAWPPTMAPCAVRAVAACV